GATPNAPTAPIVAAAPSNTSRRRVSSTWLRPPPRESCLSWEVPNRSYMARSPWRSRIYFVLTPYRVIHRTLFWDRRLVRLPATPHISKPEGETVDNAARPGSHFPQQPGKEHFFRDWLRSAHWLGNRPD